MRKLLFNSSIVGLSSLCWLCFFSDYVNFPAGASVMAAYLYSSSRQHYQKRLALYICCIIGGVSFFFLDLRLSLVVLLTLFYNSNFLPFRIRTIPYIKSFWVALCWAVFIYILVGQNSFWITFFWIWGLCQPFDIRDAKQDNFPSLSMVLGTKMNLFLASISVTIAAIIADSIAFGLASIVAILVINAFNYYRPIWYFSIVLEGLSILPWLFKILLFS